LGTGCLAPLACEGGGDEVIEPVSQPGRGARPATVKELYIYPVKGARGRRADAVHVNTLVGVEGDRRFGIKRQLDQPDVWAAKVHFRIAMNTPEMAAQVPLFADSSNGTGATAGLDQRWLRQVATALGEKELGVLDTAGRFNLVDTDPFKFGPTLSFLNLATLRALEAQTGWVIAPERFRMNVWYDDGQPFSELAWADSFPGTREFVVGPLRLRIQDACERCRAIEANPNTGQHDLPLLDAIDNMLRGLGYPGSPHRGTFRVMGFLATPLGNEVLTRGLEVRLL
jgi:uncharacterized protein